MIVLIPFMGIWGYSVVDFSRTDEQDMRTFSKEIWIVFLILGSVVGGIGRLLAGRPVIRQLSAGEATPAGGRAHEDTPTTGHGTVPWVTAPDGAGVAAKLKDSGFL
ncbi:hypothetical protein [Arthrobacter wenxiniae]|uniref:hypothetical protein n=1 Tax=Arthrobacter wenxiniae TaxID=2713570 RepID=UPI001C400B3F|nr:hypothetical protein [Arthrobacter wenxiniae]